MYGFIFKLTLVFPISQGEKLAQYPPPQFKEPEEAALPQKHQPYHILHPKEADDRDSLLVIKLRSLTLPPFLQEKQRKGRKVMMMKLTVIQL